MDEPDDFVCPRGWPLGDDGLPEGPCGYIGCCAGSGPADDERPVVTVELPGISR
ncbi:hypothetical protein [Micromonospora sediminicola]|uniref:hypothetical protein n=1 Tax=Micromonospora sediminicola TaxID=946078 RepID=UPI00378C1E52